MAGRLNQRPDPTPIPPHLRDIAITEYGIADLRGKSDRDVIVEMLKVADSAFQSGLIEAAKRAGKLESSFERMPAWAGNGPGRIAAALAPARRDGLLPAFPLGTEMTEVEQALAGSLTSLKSAGYTDLVRMLWAGVARPSEAGERSAVERMSLTSAATLREHVMRALVLGALRLRSVGWVERQR